MLIRKSTGLSSNQHLLKSFSRGFAIKLSLCLALSLSMPQIIFAADTKSEKISATSASAPADVKTSESKSSAEKKKNNPTISQEPKKEIKVQNQSQNNSGKSGQAFEELNFSKTLIIEGKVEKPQVQFTLLKEAPPEKEIRFETSFMQNILQMKRENTFKVND